MEDAFGRGYGILIVFPAMESYTTSNCFYFGRIVRATGLKGDLLAKPDVDDLGPYRALDSILVEVRGALVPFFLDRWQVRGDQVVLHFEGMGLDEARNMQGNELYLPLEMLPPLSGNRFYYHEVLGYEVVDAQAGSLGRLREIVDNTSQPVLCIDHPCGKEILMPLVDAFLESVDRENGRLHVRAPEGLVDFYLAL